MWSIHEMGVLAVQLVRMLMSVYALARVRLGLSHPIWFAHVCKAGVGIEPVYHFSFVLCGSVLVAEYLGDLAVLWWYGHGMGRWRGCGGPPGMRYEFQKSPCLSEIVLGDRAICAPSRVEWWGIGR